MRAAASCASALTGSQRLIAQQADTRFTERGAGPGGERYIFEGTLPNGIAFARNGDFLIASFGTRCARTHEPQWRELGAATRTIEGQPLGNRSISCCGDSKDRLRLTVTTRAKPWTRFPSTEKMLPDGYVALIDERGIRIAADGFVGTNQVRLDAAEDKRPTRPRATPRRIARLRVQPDGLADRSRGRLGRRNSREFPTASPSMPSATWWMTYVISDRIAVPDSRGRRADRVR